MVVDKDSLDSLPSNTYNHCVGNYGCRPCGKELVYSREFDGHILLWPEKVTVCCVWEAVKRKCDIGKHMCTHLWGNGGGGGNALHLWW